PHQLLQQVRRLPDAGGPVGLVARAGGHGAGEALDPVRPRLHRGEPERHVLADLFVPESRGAGAGGVLRSPGREAHALRDGVLMELRPENLTLLQRHLLQLLAKTRQGQRPPWLVVETGRVKVEPFAQVMNGRAASVAARGLKSMGWLRARSNGGLELAHPPATVTA